MIPRSLLAIGLTLVVAAPPGASTEAAHPDGVEAQYEELLVSFDRAMQAAEEDSAAGEIEVLEAETIAWVAAELYEEGDADIATGLLIEALGLLAAYCPPDSSAQ